MDTHAPAPLRIAPRPSLGDEVYDLLLAELISMRLPPEERLSVDGLARQFGVSQTPIRAALIRAEAEGLVVKKHNSGYSVAPQLSAARLHDLYDFRLMVEPPAAAASAAKATPEQMDALDALCAEMGQLANSRATYSRFAQTDAAFHALVCDIAGNSVVTETLARLYTHMHIFRLRYDAGITGDAAAEHQAIADAIRARDAGTAAAAMRTHIAGGRMRLEPYFKAG